MGLYELQRKLDEQLLKLYKEGALDARVSIKTKWTNEKMREIAEILAKGKIEHYTIVNTILHPTKDIGPQKHQKHITIYMVSSPFKVEEIIKEFEKIGEIEITRLQAGIRLFKGWDAGGTIWLLKEEEP